MEVIFEELPQDRDFVIFVIESKFEPLPIEEIETLLLVHESHLQKF